MYYSYVEIEYVDTSFSPARTDLAVKLLRFPPFFSTMTCSMASKSGNNVLVDSGTVEWLRLYWFCHNIGTDNSTMVARSALPKGIFPFFVVGIALELSFNVGR